MGISTIQSYCGAQIFEAVGLERDLIDRYFTGTASRIGGIGIDVIARETLDRHATAFPGRHEDLLPVGGLYYWRRDGEFHQWNPETIALVQHAVRGEGGDAQSKYDEFAEQVNDTSVKRATLRGPFQTEGGRRADSAGRGRTGLRDRQALRHRCDVAGLDLAGVPREPRDRDEPARRQVEYR